MFDLTNISRNAWNAPHVNNANMNLVSVNDNIRKCIFIPAITLGKKYFIEYEGKVRAIIPHTLKWSYENYGKSYFECYIAGIGAASIPTRHAFYKSVNDYADNNKIEDHNIEIFNILDYFTNHAFNYGYYSCSYAHYYYCYRWMWDGTKAVKTNTKVLECTFAFAIDKDGTFYYGSPHKPLEIYTPLALENTYKSKDACELDNVIQVEDFDTEVEEVETKIDIHISITQKQLNVIKSMGIDI